MMRLSRSLRYLPKLLVGLSLFSAIVGCAPVAEPDFSDRVIVRNLSGLTGGVAYVMRGDGVVTITTFGPTPSIPGISQRPGARSFDEVAAVALDAIVEVGPVSDEVCLDYGEDRLEVYRSGELIASVIATCPDDSLGRAQTLVRAAMLDGAN